MGDIIRLPSAGSFAGPLRVRFVARASSDYTPRRAALEEAGVGKATAGQVAAAFEPCKAQLRWMLGGAICAACSTLDRALAER